LKNEKEVFSLSENEMNRLGYELLGTNKINEALGISSLMYLNIQNLIMFTIVTVKHC